MELLTAAQMRAIERAAIDSGEVTGLELMERAGRGVVEAVFEHWPEMAKTPGRAVVLCGPGNNGGDGFVVARRLRDKLWDVEVWLLGDPDRLPPDARANYDIWLDMGEVRPLDPVEIAKGPRPELVIDALFGTGLSRAIPEAAALGLRAAQSRNQMKGRYVHTMTVAIDMPSGLDSDTGRMILPPRPEKADDDDELLQKWFADAQNRLHFAELTVTFHSAKIGHYIADGPGFCGSLKTVDIGIGAWDTPASFLSGMPSPDCLRLAGPGREERAQAKKRWIGRLIATSLRGVHKYHRGHVLVLSGGVGKGGAARLAARGALRMGAGLVTVCCPPAALIENAARLDAVMLRPLKDAGELAAMVEDRRITSICLGPGLGVGQRTRDMVMAAVALRSDEDLMEHGEELPDGQQDDPRRRVVLDADALTSFREDPETLFAALHRNCILTPHEGEFARLFPELAERERNDANVSKVDAARQAADRAGCTILLKGPDTVIASPGGVASLHAAVYDREAKWLGAAGSGDVLAGMIAGLVASEPIFSGPHLPVEAAAWLHVEAAREFGPGLIAEDLPEMLPKVFRKLGV